MKKFERDFILDLKKNEFDIAQDAMVNMYITSHNCCMTLGILESNNEDSYFGHMAFGSDITITKDNLNNKLEINFGSTGSFTPNKKASYYRTIHAATILKNWEKFEALFDKYHKIGKIVS